MYQESVFPSEQFVGLPNRKYKQRFRVGGLYKIRGPIKSLIQPPPTPTQQPTQISSVSLKRKTNQIKRNKKLLHISQNDNIITSSSEDEEEVVMKRRKIDNIKTNKSKKLAGQTSGRHKEVIENYDETEESESETESEIEDEEEEEEEEDLETDSSDFDEDEMIGAGKKSLKNKKPNKKNKKSKKKKSFCTCGVQKKSIKKNKKGNKKGKGKGKGFGANINRKKNFSFSSFPNKYKDVSDILT